MTLKLNAPDVNCPYCKGTGGRVRDVYLVLNGKQLSRPTKVLLHCGCLDADLARAHKEIDTKGVLLAWPWDELLSAVIPRAEGGPEVASIGSPFPAQVTIKNIVHPAPKAADTNESTPEPETPKRGRKGRVKKLR